MTTINQKSLLTSILVSVLFSVSQKTVEAQDNRFLVTKDFSATYISNGEYSWAGAEISVSFYLKNVSDGGISILLTGQQYRNFQLDHLHAERCELRSFGAIPIVREFHEDVARRVAVYIPKGDGLYVTAKAHCENVVTENHKMKDGVVSGSVTVIKGRRVLTRPISGRF